MITNKALQQDSEAKELLEKDGNLKTTPTKPGTTDRPQTASWLGMRQCYADFPVSEIEEERLPSEAKCGELVIEHLLAGGRGHYSPLEHNKILLCIAGFPHSVMQQLRTHRVGVSFSVQSGRYTSKQFLDVAEKIRNIDDVFYVRPVGEYANRHGKKYTFGKPDREEQLEFCHQCTLRYHEAIEKGMSEEQARAWLPWDIVRQPFIVGFNARSLMHILDLRSKKDAQLEIRVMSHLLFNEFLRWAPEIAQWYETNRLGKAKLAP